MKGLFSKYLSVFSCAALMLFACNKQEDAPTTSVQSQMSEEATTGLPKPAHVVIVILENHGYQEIMGSGSAPYINSLTKDTFTANFKNSYAVEHPSQPN